MRGIAVSMQYQITVLDLTKNWKDDSGYVGHVHGVGPGTNTNEWEDLCVDDAVPNTCV